MPPARRAGRQSARSGPYTRANGQPSNEPARSSASVAHATSGRGALRLTVKAPPSKLRQAISGSQIGGSSGKYAADLSDSDATPQPVGRAARSTRNVRPMVEIDTTDEDDEEDADEDEDEQAEDVEDEGEEEEGEEEDEEDEQGEDQDEEIEDEDDDAEEADDDDEMDVDGESLIGRRISKDSEEDAEGDDDDDMDELTSGNHPPPPIIKHGHGKHGKPSVTVTLPSKGLLKSVESKEMEEDDDDDDDLTDLEDEEEVGEDEGGEEEDEEDDEEDDDEDGDGDGSRSVTPDLSKLTRRQRAYYDDMKPEHEGGLMSLSNEAQKKKHLTAEEHAMRRAEMARRRKNLSEKRNEEEKMDTINKLLKKPAPKRRTRQEILAAQHAEAMGTPGAEEGEEDKPDALYVRWSHSKAGSRVGVPDEWRDSPVGEVFRPGWNSNTTKRAIILVEEVP